MWVIIAQQQTGVESYNLEIRGSSYLAKQWQAVFPSWVVDIQEIQLMVVLRKFVKAVICNIG